MKQLTKIFTVALFVSALTNLNYAQPKAVIYPMEYDFGDIVQDSVVTKLFVITNEGKDVLKINDVKASCGCTAVVAGKNELKPGESTDIKVSFDSKGKTGTQNKTITVKTKQEEMGNQHMKMDCMSKTDSTKEMKMLKQVL